VGEPDGISVGLDPSERGYVISWVDESVGRALVAVFELVGAVADVLDVPDVLLAASESLFAFSAETIREVGSFYNRSERMK